VASSGFGLIGFNLSGGFGLSAGCTAGVLGRARTTGGATGFAIGFAIDGFAIGDETIGGAGGSTVAVGGAGLIGMTESREVAAGGGLPSGGGAGAVVEADPSLDFASRMLVVVNPMPSPSAATHEPAITIRRRFGRGVAVGVIAMLDASGNELDDGAGANGNGYEVDRSGGSAGAGIGAAGVTTSRR